MQLIQLTEPTAIDIKKNMSTLGDTLSTDQLNGTVTDIGNDVDAANNFFSIKPQVSKSVDDIISNTIEENTAGLNGIAVTNGDTENKEQVDELDVAKTATEISKKHLENGSCSNGQSNENSTSNESFMSAASSVIENKVNNDKEIEEHNNESIKIVDDKEHVKVPNDFTVADVSSNDKNVLDDVASEKIAESDSTLEEISKNVSNADKSKDISISIEDESQIQKVSAFSPNSDADEKEINISAQLKQLEDDASMEEEAVSSTDVSNEIKCDTIQNPIDDTELKISSSADGSSGSSDKKIENDTKVISMLQNDIATEAVTERMEQVVFVAKKYQNVDTEINSAAKVCTETQKVIDIDKNIVPEIITSDGKNEVGFQSTVKDILSMDVVEMKQEQDNIITDETLGKTRDVTEVTLTEEKLEDKINLETIADTPPPIQKYIKVRNFLDMRQSDQKSVNEDSETAELPNEKQPEEGETQHIEETAELPNEKQTFEADETQPIEPMEVDKTDEGLVTPEISVALEIASDQQNLIQNENEQESCPQILDENIITDLNKKIDSKLPVVTDEKHLTTLKQTENDQVMEIDDVEEVPVGNKSGTDSAANKVESLNITENEKQDSVINTTVQDNLETLEDSKVKIDEATEVISIDDGNKDEVSEVSKKSSSEIEVIEDIKDKVEEKAPKNENVAEKKVEKKLPVVCKLSNTMDILSDDDEIPDEKPKEEKTKDSVEPKRADDNKCINLDDDDDIMFIEDTNSQDTKDEENKSEKESNSVESQKNETTDNAISPGYGDVDNEISSTKIEEASKIDHKDESTPFQNDSQTKINETKPVEPSEVKEIKPLITKTFLKSVTKNLAEMTRNELEDFCILKLVESVVDKSNLNEIKSKMKTMAQTVEDLRKKTLALTKQNRDLQVVVKTVQEDLKKRNANPMTPMKIIRSVGMQVVLSGEKGIPKRKMGLNQPPQQPTPSTPNKPARNIPSPKAQKPPINNIPVPRLVPASSPTVKSPATPVNNVAKPAPSRNTPPQRPEKRPHTKLNSPSSSVTVDLTDDEPPAKMNTKSVTPPVRLVPSQNLMPAKARPQFGPTGNNNNNNSNNNSPRKVYIPISNNQNLRPGASVMKNFVQPSPRQRLPSVVRMQTMRLNQIVPTTSRHPAPLPDAMKQYQPPTWKALPPAPDLTLSKVDNGIVISWKFGGYQPDTYEEVASFQLYAYQETPAPPSTALWKKIGDIKALPLPMACTLTQFMSGFKYYFAVRAIDVRSRIGPFSLPGSIMLISKS